MPFKVVQVTDTHLFKDREGEQKGVNTYQTLQAVVDDVAARHADLDALLLTGDLSQDETPESYELLKVLLAPLNGAPWYAIPGNHDDPGHMRARLEADGIPVAKDVRVGDWWIVMLDSRVPGRVHGEIGADQRQRLADTLREADGPVLVALHHPPVAVDSAWIDASRCLDGEALLDVAVSPPVKAVVCGHVHQEFESVHHGVSILAAPSTCVQFKPGVDEFAIDDAAPGYRVFELHDDGVWSTCVQRIKSN